MKVTVAMRTPESINYVHKVTGGGKLYVQHKKTQNNAVYYVWEVFQRDAVRSLVEQILPYLHTKRAQAEVFLELRALVCHKTKRSEELMQTKLALVAKIRDLKRVPA